MGLQCTQLQNTSLFHFSIFKKAKTILSLVDFSQRYEIYGKTLWIIWNLGYIRAEKIKMKQAVGIYATSVVVTCDDRERKRFCYSICPVFSQNFMRPLQIQISALATDNRRSNNNRWLLFTTNELIDSEVNVDKLLLLYCGSTYFLLLSSLFSFTTLRSVFLFDWGSNQSRAICCKIIGCANQSELNWTGVTCPFEIVTRVGLTTTLDGLKIEEYDASTKRSHHTHSVEQSSLWTREFYRQLEILVIEENKVW